jgi:hypothetical protein
MPIKVVDIQETPNPNARKFIVDGPFWDPPLSFFNAPAAAGTPLAERLFALPGVAGLLFLGNFVTVSKTAAASWSELTKAVRTALEHY